MHPKEGAAMAISICPVCIVWCQVADPLHLPPCVVCGHAVLLACASCGSPLIMAQTIEFRDWHMQNRDGDAEAEPRSNRSIAD